MTYNLSPEDIQQLHDTIKRIVGVEEERKILADDARDVLKDRAEQFGLSPALLRKAVRVAMKKNFDTEFDQLTAVGEILGFK